MAVSGGLVACTMKGAAATKAVGHNFFGHEVKMEIPNKFGAALGFCRLLKSGLPGTAAFRPGPGGRPPGRRVS